MKKSARIVGLMDYVKLLTPRYERPTHLAPLVARLERACVEPLRLVVSVPPRHFKTETISAAVSWWLSQDPSKQLAYITYAQAFSEKKSRGMRARAIKAAIPIASDASSRKDWRTGVGDGGLWATSICGPVTGEGFDIMIIDDPVKDRATAESAVYREAAWEWFNDTAFTRLEPRGSCIVNMARWHQDDLAGRLIEQGWESIVLPAINDANEALCPSRYTLAQLEKIRDQIGAYGWSSLYQGSPQARGGQLFGDVNLFDDAPASMRISIGCDLAYSEKTHADYSVAVVLGRVGDQCYVLDVIRRQVLAPEFQRTLAALREKYPNAAWRSYLAGTEKGVADVFSELGSNIGAMPPKGDKFVRAQPVAAAWNANKVFCRRGAPWLNLFVSELKAFTGVKDPHDDQVDALAAAFDVLANNLTAIAARKRKLDRFDHSWSLGGWGGEEAQFRARARAHDEGGGSMWARVARANQQQPTQQKDPNNADPE